MKNQRLNMVSLPEPRARLIENDRHTSEVTDPIIKLTILFHFIGSPLVCIRLMRKAIHKV
ncbi:hypothetical protein J40TS1_27510 [Paenibacillus montaniterrae]|uniref:Uncharacterized protein n=1 Tax=Paenibacillus montaniterrae TaxID=429341 RepID=A0A920CZL4_9BACL|nr:hypothetical protein J40TS1_27510 [Paenibacillus montaniterrae]